MPFTAKNLQQQIRAIALASRRMNDQDAEVWEARVRLIYGEMDGQRKVDFTSFAADLDRHATIIALESIYYLVSVLISTSAFHQNPAAQLLDASRLSDPQFDKFLDKVLGGNIYEDLGIGGCTDPYPLDWLGAGDNELRRALRDLIQFVSHAWDGSELKLAGDDPLQTIHRQLFPANLAHITGQFFSPEWLAELLLDDVRWKPDETLLDPFCGSGVFLVKALRSAHSAGRCPTEVLKSIVGIDINPFAAAAARANLALFIARCGPSPRDRIHLNVICADAIRPSIQDAAAIDVDDAAAIDGIFQGAAVHGFEFGRWNRAGGPMPNADASSVCSHSRSDIEQLLTHCLKADVVATNPPWVGWEYLSRPYRDSIQSAWASHDLYQSKGLEAAFLKEDLSNLALLAAWDAYLRDSGRSVVVLRPSTMHSEVASKGVRRLSLSDGGTDLNLRHIRTFDGIRLFESANTGAATWSIQKGEKTSFPVPVTAFQKLVPRWNPSQSDHASDVARHVQVIDKLAEPTDPDNAMSRWMITTRGALRSMRRLRGSNDYTPRMGVFTGGANAVFYLRRTADSDPQYSNITANSKRWVPDVQVDVEQKLVHSVARGRDISMWHCRPEVFLLLPHTRASQMYPIPLRELESDYPKTHRYFCSMREPLQARNGFANWEKKIHKQHFYTLQRIGPYTFSPYKVCWRYIASEFTVCVLSSDGDGKPVVPNDKVMFIPMNDPDEAYFVTGFLSSELVRKYVACVMEKRQISTRVIKSLAIPKYDSNYESHRVIRDCCRDGHDALDENADADVGLLKEQINELVEKMCCNWKE